VTPGPVERLKPYFKPRPRRGASLAQAPAPVAAPPPPAAPSPAAPAAPQPVDGFAARREQLASRYRELQSDLGGLVYEMAIRDHFRLDLVVRRAAELQAVDAELTAVEQALGVVPAVAGAATIPCPHCGAAGPVGSAFCARCGGSLRAAAAPPPPADASMPKPAAPAPASTPATPPPPPNPPSGPLR
jgi:hypothetical protein